MKELYWIKVNRNNIHPRKFQKYLSAIKDSLKENFPDREWLVTSDDIDIQNLGNTNSLVPANIPIESGVYTRSPFTGERTIVKLNALQKELLRSYKKPEPSLWLSSRQSGMSAMLAEIAVDHAIKGESTRPSILVMGDTLHTSHDLRLKVQDILENKYSGMRLLIDNKQHIKLENGATISFASSKNFVNSIKGSRYSLIVADLVSFYESNFFEEFFNVTRPLLPFKLILASTSLAGRNKDFAVATITKRYGDIEFDVVRMSANDIAFLENREVKKTILEMKECIGEESYLSEYLVQPRNQ